jgi:hypothetical protein
MKVKPVKLHKADKKYRVFQKEEFYNRKEFQD